MAPILSGPPPRLPRRGIASPRWRRRTYHGPTLQARMNPPSLPAPPTDAYQLLASVVENLPCGLSVFDEAHRLVLHNHHFRELLEYPEHLFQGQPRFEDFLRFNALRGDYGPGETEDHVRRVAAEVEAEPHQHVLRERPDGSALDIRRAPLPGGGFITT